MLRITGNMVAQSSVPKRHRGNCIRKSSSPTAVDHEPFDPSPTRRSSPIPKLNQDIATCFLKLYANLALVLRVDCGHHRRD